MFRVHETNGRNLGAVALWHLARTLKILWNLWRGVQLWIQMSIIESSVRKHTYLLSYCNACHQNTKVRSLVRNSLLATWTCLACPRNIEHHAVLVRPPHDGVNDFLRLAVCGCQMCRTRWGYSENAWFVVSSVVGTSSYYFFLLEYILHDLPRTKCRTHGT